MNNIDILDEARDYCAVEGTDIAKMFKYKPIKIPSIMHDYMQYFAGITRKDVEYLLTTNWELLQ